MPESTRDGQRRIELFVRDDLPGPVQHRLAAFSARLEQLVADGDIDSYTVHQWSKRQPLAGAETSQRSQYTSFSEWARDAGVRLSPGFGTRRCYSPETGEPQESLVFPVVCLAVYDGDRLAAVYPHSDDGGVHTIADAIETLCADRVVTLDREPSRPLTP